MTVRGIVFAVSFALVLLLALGTGIREIYFLLFCMALLFLFALASALVGAAALHGTQTLSATRVMRRNDALLQVTLTGFLLFPLVVSIRVKQPQDPSFLSKQAFFSLLPGIHHPALSIPLYTLHRGRWNVQTERLRVHDLFGFWALPLLRKGAVSPLPDCLTVYPLVYEPGEELSEAAIPFDDAQAPNFITDHGDSFVDTRLYRDGDSLKRIHWKQSIRTRELYTRQYENTAEPYTLLLLDTVLPLGADTLWYADMAGECAATLGFFYVHHKQTLRLWSMGETNACLCVTQAEDFDAFHTFLAEVPFFTAAELPDISTLLRQDVSSLCTVHVITSRPSLPLLDTLQTLQQHCRVTCIVPPTPTALSLVSESQQRQIPLLVIRHPQDLFKQAGDYL